MRQLLFEILFVSILVADYLTTDTNNLKNTVM